MGVSGLTSWLEEHGQDHANLQELAHGAEIHIDGNGLAWHLLLAERKSATRKLDETAAEPNTASVAIRLAAYAAFGDAVDRALATLRRAGLVPTVYLDGRATRLKAGTLSSRQEERAARWERLQAAFLDGRGAAALDLLPEPPLMLDQLAASVEAAGVPLVRCDGEADPEIAHAAARTIAQGRQAYILAADSDFCLYAGVVYVPFAELSLHSGAALWPLHEPPPPSVAAAGRVVAVARCWRRLDICEVSGLDERTVVVWALLGGNDFTGGFPAAAWGAALAPQLGDSAGGGSRARLERIREGLASGLWAVPAVDGDEDDGGLALASCVESAQLREAVLFSRALYEHGDLRSFPLDRKREGDEVEVLPRRGVPLQLGAVALAEVEHGGVICRHRPGASSVESGAARPRQGCMAWHAAALRRVLAGERVPVETLPAGALQAMIRWDDVLVARCYQAACRALLRSDLFGAAVPPSQLFDGPSFYALCHDERQRHPPPPVDPAAYGPPLVPPSLLSPPPPLPSPSPRLPRAPKGLVPLAAMRSSPAATGPQRRQGSGKCAECGGKRRGEHDDSEEGGGLLYCIPCWRAYGEQCAAAPSLLPPSSSSLPLPSSFLRSPPAPQRTPAAAPPPTAPPMAPLPVDAYADEIVQRAGQHRVSIISGATGCGKSSRVPLILLERLCSSRGKIMVAQPRRIAAYGLYQRAKQMGSAGGKVGLRMGSDIRIEEPGTRLWYMTTGCE